MNARINFAIPYRTSAKLVRITTFGQQQIAWKKLIALNFGSRGMDGLDKLQIQPTILNINNSHVRDFIQGIIRWLSAFCDPRTDCAYLIKRGF